MKQIKTISIGVVVALIIAIIALFTPVVPVSAPAPVANNLGGGITNYDSLVFSGGVCSVSTGILVTALQLTAANLTGCPVLSITSGTSTTLTVTMPASSTMSSIVPGLGDTTSINIYSASTTAGIIVFAATSSGFALNSVITAASTTAATTTLQAGKMGNLNYSRIPTTDIIGIFSPAR